jgi:hypothetical protein
VYRGGVRARTPLFLAALSSIVVACGSSGTQPFETPTGSAPEDGGGTPASSSGGTVDATAPVNDAGAGTACVPSTDQWASLVPGQGQAGYDAALASAVAKYDRYHEAVGSFATGLSGSNTLTTDASARQKLEHLLATPWSANDGDPTDDLLQYESLDPKTLVTSWGLATGMYAGSELAADAYRYGVLRDRAGTCNDMARARKMLQLGLDAFHIAVAITGGGGSIARAIARKDLPGDGKAPVVPLFDAQKHPLPAEKNNGTWRADNSKNGAFASYIWWDSCSRDMLFGWTMGIAAAWEVIQSDPTFSTATKDQLRADAKSVLDGLMVVRPSGKDLELWDPDGRITLNGNMHETSVDRSYLLENGVASMMALGEIAGLVYVVDDAPAKAYLNSLVTTRGLPVATTQTMDVIALGGDASNHSSFNMLFMTAWMAHRYLPDAAVRTQLRAPVENSVYRPFFGAKPSDWKQSFFDFVVAASTGDAWVSGPASSKLDATAVARGVETLKQFPAAPFYALPKINCDDAEVAAKQCVLLDGTTVVNLSSVKAGIVADKPIPMAYRPPSNFFWRTNPFLVNSPPGGSDPNVVFPGSDLRASYWMGRWVRRAP